MDFYEKDQAFMRLAIDEAMKASALGGSPNWSGYRSKW